MPGRLFNEAVSAAEVRHRKDDYVLPIGKNGKGSLLQITIPA